MNHHAHYLRACRYLENLGKLETPLEYMGNRKEQDLRNYIFRMQDLLNRLGNPEKNMKHIHVTGTAGKGTTTALIHNLLQNEGYKVGSISSPATTTTLERIKVDELYINPEDFARIIESLQPIIQDMYLNGPYGKPSYFDIVLAIAFIYFKQEQCDYIVLEVGMGGRYDSTNVIETPELSIITNVGYDHIHLLGDKLETIAYEKAGIIKSGSTFFTTEVSENILEIFKRVCDEENADYNHVAITKDPNHDLLIAVSNHLGIEKEHVQKAIEDTRLPCRFEIMETSPFIILDGAHNVSKVKFSLEKLKNLDYKNLNIIFGCGDTKDALGMLEEIAKHTSHITLMPVTSSMGKSFSVKKMKQYLNTEHPKVLVAVHLDADGALLEQRALLGEGDALLCIGSLYLTGQLRKNWYTEEYILDNRSSF